MHQYTEEHLKMAQSLLKESGAHDGLAPLDIEKFWADEEISRKDSFNFSNPQMPLGIRMSHECVFAELGIEEDVWRQMHDEDWRLDLHRAYNDKSEKIVGRRLLSEKRSDPNRPHYPPVKALHDIFEAHNEWHAGSWWLQQSAHDEAELSALLDRVEKRLENLRAFILPEGWDAAREKLMPQGIKPSLYRGQRGPVTFAASVYGVENLVFLIMTNPPLAARFRDAILRSMLEMARILDEEAGYTPETAPHGFGWADDNCYLLTPEMYEFFGYPILQGIFSRYSPNPGDRRGQHSDSPMGHLLPLLGKLRLNHVNFGPTVMISEIRKHIPDTIIAGQLAPFTFSRNEEENIILECLRDFEMSREKRGVVFTCAGSINNGSMLTGMRLIMATIQKHCRYNG